MFFRVSALLLSPRNLANKHQRVGSGFHPALLDSDLSSQSDHTCGKGGPLPSRPCACTECVLASLCQLCMPARPLRGCFLRGQVQLLLYDHCGVDLECPQGSRLLQCPEVRLSGVIGSRVIHRWPNGLLGAGGGCGGGASWKEEVGHQGLSWKCSSCPCHALSLLPCCHR